MNDTKKVVIDTRLESLLDLDDQVIDAINKLMPDGDPENDNKIIRVTVEII